MKHPELNPHQEYIFKIPFFSLELFELIPVDDFKENEGLVLGKYTPLVEDDDDDYDDEDDDDKDEEGGEDAEMREFEATFGCWRSSGPPLPQLPN